MKFAFSTLGCPRWSWEEIISTASDMGYDGVELRGIGSQIYLPHVKNFSPELLPEVKDQLVNMKLEVPCLTTGAFLFDPEKKEAALKEVKEYLTLANGLRVPYLRVLADANPDPGIVNESMIVDNLSALLPLAEELGVTLLLETNGVYAQSEKLAALMKKINHPSLAVLWDIHHPYRYFNETAEDTYANLKAWIKHVHIKDSIVKDGKVEYRMFGYGDVPAAEAINILLRDGYQGYVVLEWVKRWCMDLEEPGIVFHQYLNAMKNLLP